MDRVYNVVNSVKGGCGKTTFALMLAAGLDRLKESQLADGSCQTDWSNCILDFDFLGTSMISLFKGDSDINTWKTDEGGSYIYLNERLRGFRSEDKRYIVSIDIGDADRRHFNIGFSDPDEKEKEKYRCDSKCNYIPATKFGVFRRGMQNILKPGELEEQVPNDVKHVIFDLPPSNDTYANAVINCMFDKRNSVIRKDKDVCNYFLMMGMDLSHLNATEQYLLDFLRGEDLFPHRIFLVFNNLFPQNDSEDWDLYEARKRELETNIQSALSGKADSLKPKIYFVVMNQCVKYQRIIMGYEGIKGKSGLTEVTVNGGDIFPNPIMTYARCGEEFKKTDNVEKAFYKLLEGEKADE